MNERAEQLATTRQIACLGNVLGYAFSFRRSTTEPPWRCGIIAVVVLICWLDAVNIYSQSPPFARF